VDLARIEPIARHHAILLHDRHVRSTVALGQEPQRRDRRPTLAGVTNRAGAAAATLVARGRTFPSPESSELLWTNPSGSLTCGPPYAPTARYMLTMDLRETHHQDRSDPQWTERHRQP